MNRPRHLRAVSSLIPRSAAIRVLAQAAGRGQHDLRPQPVPPGGFGAADPFLQRLALSSGQGDGHGPRGSGIDTPRTEHTRVIRSRARIIISAVPAEGTMRRMAAIPQSTRDSITWRLLDHAAGNWPAEESAGQYRGAFAYVAGVFPSGEQIPLSRLRYGGSAHSFGFAIYSAARGGYQDAVLRTGLLIGTPQEALDTACTVHLAGLGHEPDPQPSAQPPNLRGHPLSLQDWILQARPGSWHWPPPSRHAGCLLARRGLARYGWSWPEPSAGADPLPLREHRAPGRTGALWAAGDTNS